MSVAIVQTGIANTASLLAAFQRQGVEAKLCNSAADIQAATHLVLPGVGSFGAGMELLSSGGLVEPLRTRVLEGKPTLSVCLGMHLLCEQSEESPGVSGLGIFPIEVKRFTPGVCIPQFGWNAIEPSSESELLQEGYAYFANSYRLSETPRGFAPAKSIHGEEFISAMERGAVLCCQFHPELSGSYGAALIERWLGNAY